MKKFRFKPIEFKACQFDPKENQAGVKFTPEKGHYVDTFIDGRVYLEAGDWILYNSKEQTLVVSDAIFHAFFEEI